MNILFYSKTYFMDCDLPYIVQLRAKGISVKYLLEIAPHSKKSTFFNIELLYPKAGLFKANIYKKELPPTIQNVLDWENTIIINRTSNKVFALSNMIVSIKLLFFLMKQKFDVLHSTVFFDFNEWPIYFFRKKILLTVHDPFPHTGELTRRKNMNRKIGMKLFKSFLLLNEAQKSRFIAMNKLQSFQVYSSKLGAYIFLKSYLKESTKPMRKYILFFGRISPYKGIEFLLKAMLKVHEVHPSIHLIIAGNGKFNFDITKYVALDYVEIRNRFIPTEELVELIDASMFVVCPYTDATQSGVIMSSYAFNKPVIASDVGGLSEMVKQRKTGLLVPPSNADKLSEAIIELLNNNDLLNDFSQNIKNQYEDGLSSWNVIASDMISVYAEMINK